MIYILDFESVAAIARIAGVVFLLFELRRLLARLDDMDAGLRVARGEMTQVMDRFFEDWRLTEAERDVALMVPQGLGQRRNRAGQRNRRRHRARAGHQHLFQIRNSWTRPVRKPLLWKN